MKLSEKIQEALREQQEINLSDPTVQKRLAAQWGYVPAGAQPAPSFADAYQGAMEEVAIWKKRALEAEDLNRKFIAEINGPTYMGGPAQPAPSFADAYQGAMEEVAIWKKRALEAEDLNRKFVAEINGPTYMGGPAQPAPSVPDGWKLVPIEPTDEMLRAIRAQRSGARKGRGDRADWKAWLAAAPEAKP